MNTRWRMMGGLLVLLFAAGVVVCLFSRLLPSSASLLASTQTQTPTVTSTPSPTLPPTITTTPLAGITSSAPDSIVLPDIQIAAYTMYVTRDLWEQEAGKTAITETFESDISGFTELYFPYTTTNGFLLEGHSPAQIIGLPELLPVENLLLVQDWDDGLTFTFPNAIAPRAFGFNYTAREEWHLTFNDSVIPLSLGENRFVGFVLYQNFPTQFTLLGPDTAQHNLLIDNISYASDQGSALLTPNPIQNPTYTVVWNRGLWESVVGNQYVVEDFETYMGKPGELILPYVTGNGFQFNGVSLAQVLDGTGNLDSGNLLHFRDTNQGLAITFRDDTPARAFGFDYTTNEEWHVTFHNVDIKLPEGTKNFVGVILSQDYPTKITLSSPAVAQGGLSMDNILYVP